MTLIFKLFMELKKCKWNKIKLKLDLTCYCLVTLFFENIVKINKQNCSGSLTFKSQRVGYHSNQKLLHQY